MMSDLLGWLPQGEEAEETGGVVLACTFLWMAFQCSFSGPVCFRPTATSAPLRGGGSRFIYDNTGALY